VFHENSARLQEMKIDGCGVRHELLTYFPIIGVTWSKWASAVASVWGNFSGLPTELANGGRVTRDRSRWLRYRAPPLSEALTSYACPTSPRIQAR